MNAPVNNYKTVIIEKDLKGELTISEKETDQGNSSLETEGSVELNITLEQWEKILTSTLEKAMKIIEGLYCENFEEVNY